VTTSLDRLNYLVEYLYLRAQIVPAPTEAIVAWKSYFDQFLEEANSAYCHRLLSVIRRTDLTLTIFGRGVVRFCEGALYDFEGDIQRAFRSYETCLDDFRNAEISMVEQQRWVSDILGRSASLQKTMGNFVEASRLYNTQLEIYRNSEGSQRKMAGTLSELTDVALMQDDYKNAIVWLENHLEIALELGYLGDQLDVLLKLIPLYQRSGEFSKADQLCEHSLLLAEELHNQSAVVTSLGLQALVRIE
jgi:tetratricopeptide (TPR) repeat protein